MTNPLNVDNVMKVVNTISRIATFAKITYSTPVTNINDDRIANLREMSFRPIKYNPMPESIAHVTLGILTVNSLHVLNIANDKHSIQKYNGGLSQKTLPSRYIVTKS